MSTAIEHGTLKVWYVPQVPMKAFEFVIPPGQFETATSVLHALSTFSLFEFTHRVKPDYADAGGIAIWHAGLAEWHELDKDDLEGSAAEMMEVPA